MERTRKVIVSKRRATSAVSRVGLLMAVVVAMALVASPASAADEAAAQQAREEITVNLNVVWTCIAAFLVFFMQAGFAMVETGFTRAKNAVNILMKNLMDFSFGTIAFFLVGFGLMFGDKEGGWFIGKSLLALGDTTGESWNYSFLLFQTVFAAT